MTLTTPASATLLPGLRLGLVLSTLTAGLVGCGEESNSNADLTALQEQLDDLGQTVDDQALAIATLEAQLAAATGDIDLSALDDLNDRIEALEDLADLADELEDLTDRVDELEGELVPTDISGLETRVTALEGEVVPGLRAFVSADVDNDKVVFTGANVYVQSGSGSTDDGGSLTGLGNLIIGYNADVDAEGAEDLSGSHNLVLGDENSYTSYGGLVSGYDNETSGIYAVAVGGYGNVASGRWSGLFAGNINEASGDYAAIVGSHRSLANGDISTISGGRYNTSSGYLSSVSGGDRNVASGELATVGGGQYQTASSYYSFAAP